MIALIYSSRRAYRFAFSVFAMVENFSLFVVTNIVEESNNLYFYWDNHGVFIFYISVLHFAWFHMEASLDT